MTDHMARYLELLGLQPGASWDEINTTYFTLIENSPKNPTEEQEEQQQQLKHAYSLLRRAYMPAPARKATLNPRLLMPAMLMLALVLGVTYVAMNYQEVRLMIVQYQPGDVIRFKNEESPYGKVLRYDPEHRFHAGEPAGAYEIALSGKDEIVWLSERIVVKGMVPIAPASSQAAGVGGPDR